MSVYIGETKKKIISRSTETNKRASKVTGNLLEQLNKQKNVTAISNGYTPKLSPLEIGTLIEK